jgi:hypothetical protein
MILVITGRNEVHLEDPLDNKRFHIEIRSASMDLAWLSSAFAPYGIFESRDHAWVETKALRSWSGIAQQSAYLAGLNTMLIYAAKKGWMNPDGTRVRAHVIWCASGS